ncbi:MAG: QueT transporter family protein [Clostridiales bacterium]|nr:QueT transporter family protein [Clostridiales bacterium]
MKNKKVMPIVWAGMIAAIYVVLTIFISSFGLASGAIQIRVSEALTILPYFTSAAIPGLSIGCLVANLLTGAPIYDVIFGSLATFLGAVGTYLLRRHKFLCTLPPVVSNVIIIPLVLRYGYGLTMEVGGMDLSIPFYMLTVGIGQIICCCVLGTLLRRAMSGIRHVVFQEI